MAFRELVGPHDPEIAKAIRKSTIRANFGLDRVKNAIHCTDLPEDGVLEVRGQTFIGKTEIVRILFQHSPGKVKSCIFS